MSKKRTRHIKNFITKDGYRVVINTIARTYHLRSAWDSDDWDHLVREVVSGNGANYTDFDYKSLTKPSEIENIIVG